MSVDYTAELLGIEEEGSGTEIGKKQQEDWVARPEDGWPTECLLTKKRWC